MPDKKTSGREETVIIAEPGRQETVVTHVFDYPPEQVFAAFTDPELIAQWWAPERSLVTVDRMEVRGGGQWRFIIRDTEGKVHAFHGVYHEVTRPKRLVYTLEYEGLPGHVLLAIVTFREQDGRTRLTEKFVLETVEDRDREIEAWTRDGAPRVMDRLEDLLSRMKRKEV